MTNVMYVDGMVMNHDRLNVTWTKQEKQAWSFVKEMQQKIFDKGVKVLTIDAYDGRSIVCSSPEMSVPADVLVLRKVWELASKAGISGKLAHSGNAGVSYEFWMQDK